MDQRQLSQDIGTGDWARVGPFASGLLLWGSWLFAGIGAVGLAVHYSPSIEMKLDFLRWPGLVGSGGLIVCGVLLLCLRMLAGRSSRRAVRSAPVTKQPADWRSI